MDVGGAGIGLRLASSAFQPLIRRLFPQQAPGAGLVDQSVRVSALMSFKGEKRTLTEKDLRKLSEELVRRVVRAIGPHDAPSDDEVLIVSDVLARSLVRLGELDMNDVQAVRLGHERLAERIGAPIDLFHSPHTYTLYRRLLDQCCLHILNFFTQRSTFVARTLVEQSRQLDQLATRIDLLIERIGHRSSDDAAFEKRYADYIKREHGRLTIYGLDLYQEREWPLDDAYLSLEARGDRDTPPQRAERALAGQERVLLRGLAGSGKTTLVQWLAVATARQGADADAGAGDGLTHLLGRVPFLLPMRTLTRDGAAPPTPDRFLAAINCPLAAAQPDGWIDRVLSARRGLLLVDGIDEIPEAHRDAVRLWVRRVIASYPGNLWLVTARPSAIRDDWLGQEAFTELTLAPMGGGDVQAFIHRWHRAAGADDETGNALFDLIRSRTDLSALATNPLMCAMICALHRERHRYLPHGRKALYDAALMMLLERRDRERPDPPRVGVEALDADTQISLLQKLAYWLANNGQSEMAKQVAASLITQALPVLHRVAELGLRPEQVLRHLIERSGVLREPAAGAVDFIHRTFQDYLAAREIVEWQHFPALVEKAHDDQWEDVVRMAVAYAQPIQRGEILARLVELGDRESDLLGRRLPEHAVPPEDDMGPQRPIRLHLLAIACLDDATQLPAAVRAEVVARSEGLIPPRVPSEAVALANSGPVVVDLLPGPETLTDAEAETVVFTASRIASDAALSRMRAFRNHPSPEVRQRLAMSWPRFDTRRYFDEIVSHLDPEDGVLFPASSLKELRLLGTLPGLSAVTLRGAFPQEEILAALDGRPVTALELRENTALKDLQFLSRFPGLTSLTLDSCPLITDLSSLAALGLRKLSLYGNFVHGWAPEGLGSLATLHSLRVREDVLISGAPPGLPGTAPLRDLALPVRLPDLSGIRAWPMVARLDIHDSERSLDMGEWQAIADLPRLRNLIVDPFVLDVPAVTRVRLPHVVRAEMNAVHPDTTHGRLDRYYVKNLALTLPGLEEVVFHTDADFAPLAELPRLRTIYVRRPTVHHNVPPNVEVIAPAAPRY